MAFSTLVVAITLLSIILNSTASGSTTSGGTFTVDLIHRDSIDSPFYDRSMSFSQRIGHALQRSFSNAKRFKPNPNRSTYKTDVIPDHGEFLLNISIGNPPHKLLAIADTGSDLSWMQCNPCLKCYEHTGPLFNPKHSSTYKPIRCESAKCKAIELETSCTRAKNCQFFESYADGSFSNGTVSTETVTLGGRVFHNIVFGCSYINDGVFRPTWGGIIGLGGGDTSLVSQINSLVPNKFSYCLIPFPATNDFSNKSSKMTFGDIDFGPNVVSTPLVQITPKTFYLVTLEAISVGKKRLNFSNISKPSPKGNLIVDSGTTLTMLPDKLYKGFEAALKDAINARTMKDPQQALNLCYRSASVAKLPKVTMHFEGADVELSRDNLFVTVSKHFMCLAFASTSNLPVMGNVAQINIQVGFDFENKMVLFKRTDCERM